jgi:hypothetical protein
MVHMVAPSHDGGAFLVTLRDADRDRDGDRDSVTDRLQLLTGLCCDVDTEAVTHRDRDRDGDRDGDRDPDPFTAGLDRVIDTLTLTDADRCRDGTTDRLRVRVLDTLDDSDGEGDGRMLTTHSSHDASAEDTSVVDAHTSATRRCCHIAHIAVAHSAKAYLVAGADTHR